MEVMRNSGLAGWGSQPNHNPESFIDAAGGERIKGESGVGFGDGGRMEQLVLRCAWVVESRDVTRAQQLMWVLNNIASPDGDSNQRLASAFLRALVSRAARLGMDASMAAASSMSRMSVMELAEYVDLTPWYRFGFTAANEAIAEAVEGCETVHIIDLGMTHCMQWPTLIESLSKREERPPSLIRLTVPGSRPPVPPLLDMGYEQLGLRLANFARSRNTKLEFRVAGNHDDVELEKLLNPSALDIRVGEAVVVNCQFRLHYEARREAVLMAIRALKPRVVTLVEEDWDLTANSLVSRVKAAYNCMWIPFDAVDTFLPRNSPQRLQYENDVCHRIENIIAFDGPERVESGETWGIRMAGCGFQSIAFTDHTVSTLRCMLQQHSAGWGMSIYPDSHLLRLTWKGHHVLFSSAWVPS